MFKFWLALLLVLHALVLAWHWDAFAPWGLGPQQHREPERLKQQVRPEALKFEIMPPAAPVNTETAEPAATDASAEASIEASSVAQSAQASAPDAASSAPALPASAAVAPRAKPGSF
jgi:cytoskeletal protein RodZ